MAGLGLSQLPESESIVSAMVSQPSIGDSVINSPDSRERQSYLELVGMEDPRISATSKKYRFSEDGLNYDQMYAIDHALNVTEGIQLIQGPPGTGKTKTGSILLDGLLMRKLGYSSREGIQFGFQSPAERLKKLAEQFNNDEQRIAPVDSLPFSDLNQRTPSIILGKETFNELNEAFAEFVKVDNFDGGTIKIGVLAPTNQAIRVSCQRYYVRAKELHAQELVSRILLVSSRRVAIRGDEEVLREISLDHRVDRLVAWLDASLLMLNRFYLMFEFGGPARLLVEYVIRQKENLKNGVSAQFNNTFRKTVNKAATVTDEADDLGDARMTDRYLEILESNGTIAECELLGHKKLLMKLIDLCRLKQRMVSADLALGSDIERRTTYTTLADFAASKLGILCDQLEEFVTNTREAFETVVTCSPESENRRTLLLKCLKFGQRKKLTRQEECSLREVEKKYKKCFLTVWNRDSAKKIAANVRHMITHMEALKIGEHYGALYCPVFLQEADMIFSTVSVAGRFHNIKLSMDTVVVDEAAQVPEASNAIFCRSALKQLVLIGDPKQLPACVLSPICVAKRFGVSLLERLMENGHERVLLGTQYRMDPVISAFANNNFYGGVILDGENVIKNRGCRIAADRKSGTALSPDSNPCMFHDVVLRGFLSARGINNQSKQNELLPALRKRLSNLVWIDTSDISKDYPVPVFKTRKIQVLPHYDVACLSERPGFPHILKNRDVQIHTMSRQNIVEAEIIREQLIFLHELIDIQTDLANKRAVNANQINKILNTCKPSRRF